MKWLRTSLRLLVAAGSISGFLGGWVLFAHAGKPVAPDAAPAPAIAPAPSFAPSNAPSFRLQPSQSLPPSNFSMGPRLRTRGS